VSAYPPANERIGREQFLRAVDHATELEAEAVRCAEGEAWFAACLVAGCALEALLLANVLAHEPEMEVAGRWQPVSKKPPEEWGLTDLVRFHREQGWIDEPVGPLDLAHGAKFVTWIRNVAAHPGRLIREAHEFTFDEKAASIVYMTVHRAFDETAAKLYGADTQEPKPTGE
jgi:hypothetical protein